MKHQWLGVVTKALSSIEQRGLMTPSVMLAAARRGWMSAEDVRRIAIAALEVDSPKEQWAFWNDNDEPASGVLDRLADWERRSKVGNPDPIRVLAWGILDSLRRMNSNEDDAMNFLEICRADLGYPDFMDNCSRYVVDDGVDHLRPGDVVPSPIAIADDLRKMLESELGVSPFPN